MRYTKLNMHDFAMDSRSMVGTLDAKLLALKDAGFSQVMLWASDLVGYPAGLEAAVAAVRNSGLRVTGLKALNDFEGLEGAAYRHKVSVARSLLDLCQSVGCRRLMVCATRLVPSTTQTAELARDLRRLAVMAVPGRTHIVYSATLGAHCAGDYLKAWDLVCEADMPNLGLGIGIDALNLLQVDGAMEDLEMLDPDKIFMVELADRLWDDTIVQPLEYVFPGEGNCSNLLAAQVKKLHELGYRGDYSFDVANTDYLDMPLEAVIRTGMQAAIWLGEEVLQRSVPLPNDIRLRKRQCD